MYIFLALISILNGISKTVIFASVFFFKSKLQCWRNTFCVWKLLEANLCSKNTVKKDNVAKFLWCLASSIAIWPEAFFSIKMKLQRATHYEEETIKITIMPTIRRALWWLRKNASPTADSVTRQVMRWW